MSEQDTSTTGPELVILIDIADNTSGRTIVDECYTLSVRDGSYTAEELTADVLLELAQKLERSAVQS